MPIAEKKMSSRQSNGETIQYRRGMRVLHPTFGEGVILAVEGRGAEMKLSVHFDTVGAKLLLARYAPLQKVD
ncbi:MAG: hypothetical protein N2663_08000 [Chlorobi bacterium]|nr:hypothetical protein [Chlorobiota bacterium]